MYPQKSFRSSPFQSSFLFRTKVPSMIRGRKTWYEKKGNFDRWLFRSMPLCGLMTTFHCRQLDQLESKVTTDISTILSILQDQTAAAASVSSSSHSQPSWPRPPYSSGGRAQGSTVPPGNTSATTASSSSSSPNAYVTHSNPHHSSSSSRAHPPSGSQGFPARSTSQPANIAKVGHPKVVDSFESITFPCAKPSTKESFVHWVVSFTVVVEMDWNLFQCYKIYFIFHFKISIVRLQDQW